MFSKIPFFKKENEGTFFESKLKLKLAQKLFYNIFRSELTERYKIFKVLLSKSKSPFIDASNSK